MNDLTEQTPQNRWFTDGPTMASSRRLYTGYWLITLVLFVFLNMFDLRLRLGVWIRLNGPYESIPLIPQLLAPLSLFHYPSQILIKASVMAMLCTVPILIALLYNLLYALPFIAVVFFLGLNPILTLCLFFSCAAASFEPLRFKSKFVAFLLCLLPEMLYWAFFSGENPETDILRWAVLYSPWALAFLLCLLLAGGVILIGHFLRYRPGILMPIFGLMLASTILFFNYSVGMNERDYQDQVAQNSPWLVPEFQNLNILPLLEEELVQRKKQTPYLTDDQILKQLRMEWRWAFLSGSTLSIAPDQTTEFAGPRFPLAKRKITQILDRYSDIRDGKIEQFIQTHKHQKRLPDALYFQALYFDMRTDQRRLRDEDMLSFYFDVPSPESMPLWQELLKRFPDSDVSIEARWRLARRLAEQKPASAEESFQYEQALKLLDEAEQKCRLKLLQIQKETGFRFLRRFGLDTVITPPPPTITGEQWLNLQFRIYKLKSLISPENRTGHVRHEERLAEFVSLDPRQFGYQAKLKNLLLDSPQPDPLLDNIELAEAMLLQDPEERIVRLNDLIKQYKDRDGGIEASLQLALEMLQQKNTEIHPADRQTLLLRAREQLQSVIKAKPDSFWADYARTLLQNNPLE